MRIIDANNMEAADADTEAVVAVRVRGRFRMPGANSRKRCRGLKSSGFSQPFVMMERNNEQTAERSFADMVGKEGENDAADRLILQRQHIGVCIRFQIPFAQKTAVSITFRFGVFTP